MLLLVYIAIFSLHLKIASQAFFYGLELKFLWLILISILNIAKYIRRKREEIREEMVTNAVHVFCRISNWVIIFTFFLFEFSYISEKWSIKYIYSRNTIKCGNEENILRRIIS